MADVRYPIGSLAERVLRGERIKPLEPTGAVLPMPPASNEGPQVFRASRFVLESGDVIQGLEIHYETWGRQNQFGTNTILVCHGRSGNRLAAAGTIGPGKAFDTDRYFVVAMDALGAGQSSSPMSSDLRMSFPRYTVRDMVRAQCLALTRGLGVTQLRCVAGSSLGAFLAIEWAVTYPAFVKAAVCVLPAARASAHSRAINDGIRAALLADREWLSGDYAGPPADGLQAAAAVEFPWRYGEEWYLQYEDQRFYQERLEWELQRAQQRDANNLLYETFAWDSHDVSAPYGGDLAAALGRCRMPVLLMPCATDLLVPPRNAQLMQKLLPNSAYVEIRSYAGHAAAWLEAEYVEEMTREFLAGLHR